METMNPDDTFACARAKLNAVSHGTCGRMFIRANAKHARGGERTYSPCEGCPVGCETAAALGLKRIERLPALGRGALRAGLTAHTRTIDDLETP
jgi:hypothetical protein